MNLAFHPLALSRWDRILLYGGGVCGFRKGSGPAPERSGGRSHHRKEISNYGRTREHARAFIKEGNFAPGALRAYAERHKINYDSLKASVCKIRSDRREAA